VPCGGQLRWRRNRPVRARVAGKVSDRVCVCVQVYWYQEVFIDILKLIGLQQNLATFKI
jgi:hypothetical protein